MTEQFANKIETTVNLAYTAGSGTLVVASDTGMPATGTFRVRLGNVAGSILRVDSRAGATLTVTAEADDGNALVGDTATVVLTAGAIAQLKTDVAGGGTIDRLFSAHVDAPTTGTADETLYSFTVPAGQLATNGDSLRIVIAFVFAANVNGKSAALEFGSTLVWGTGQAGFSGHLVWVYCDIFRITATTQKAIAYAIYDTPTAPSALGGANVVGALEGAHSSRVSPAETLSGTVDLRFRASTVATAGDLTGLYMTVDYYPAA